MKLELKRTEKHAAYVIGELYVDGSFQCYTLERPSVMIPCGTYPVVLYDSPAHKMKVPLLQDVPGRSSIEIHIGNFPADSKGCILVGRVKEEGYIEQSKMAFTALMRKLEACSQPISLTIF